MQKIAILPLSFGLALLGAAQGAGAVETGQAEWAQRYDADARLTVSRSTTPILSEQTVQATESAIEHFREIVANGGWPAVPSQQLRLGSNSGAVSALRRRLIVSGDIGQETGTSQVFDSYVEAGVRRFQARHGIIETGVVNQQTLAALNVPAETRLRQLETNLVRLRSFSRDLGNRYVTANIPAAQVETVENGSGRHPPHRRRWKNRPPVAGDADEGLSGQFQSVLDRAGVGHPQRSHPEDAGRFKLPA